MPSTVARSDASVPQSFFSPSFVCLFFFMEMNRCPQYLCAIVAEQRDIALLGCSPCRLNAADI